jgi:hypothetical protein
MISKEIKMKLIRCLLICAALLPVTAFSQAPAPKIVSLSTLDANNDQVITKDEALKAGMPEAVFKKIDKDNSGQISKAELNAYRSESNSISAIDADKDGRISKAEAVKLGMSAQEFRILDKDNNGYITQAEWDSGDWRVW